MSSESLQHKLDRVRRPRVQITYDVETGGAMVKTELPFVVGVMADLSGQPKTALRPLKERIHRYCHLRPPRREWGSPRRHGCTLAGPDLERPLAQRREVRRDAEVVPAEDHLAGDLERLHGGEVFGPAPGFDMAGDDLVEGERLRCSGQRDGEEGRNVHVVSGKGRTSYARGRFAFQDFAGVSFHPPRKETA